jgi:hypothetical protein
MSSERPQSVSKPGLAISGIHGPALDRVTKPPPDYFAFAFRSTFSIRTGREFICYMKVFRRFPRRSYSSGELRNPDCIDIAPILLFGHEQFHHAVESFSSRSDKPSPDVSHWFQSVVPVNIWVRRLSRRSSRKRARGSPRAGGDEEGASFGALTSTGERSQRGLGHATAKP